MHDGPAQNTLGHACISMPKHSPLQRPSYLYTYMYIYIRISLYLYKTNFGIPSAVICGMRGTSGKKRLLHSELELGKNALITAPTKEKAARLCRPICFKSLRHSFRVSDPNFAANLPDLIAHLAPGQYFSYSTTLVMQEAGSLHSKSAEGIDKFDNTSGFVPGGPMALLECQ